jgi:hypothetical protein
MGGHRDQLPHRNHAGPTDARDQQVEAVIDVGDIRVGQIRRAAAFRPRP